MSAVNLQTNQLVALVPMRHDSERVSGKNYRQFAGRPMYHHIIESLLLCPEISKVIIDTDSPIITEDALRSFPAVTVLERPEHLRRGDIAMNEVLLNTISQVTADFYLQTHSTNPLLQPETISRAVRLFTDNYPNHDSLFGATRWQTRLWDGAAQAINHDPATLLRTQDLPPIYEENSNLYIFTGDRLEKRGNRIGDNPLIFEIDRLEAWDIDEEADFRVAELIYLYRHGIRKG